MSTHADYSPMHHLKEGSRLSGPSTIEGNQLLREVEELDKRQARTYGERDKRKPLKVIEPLTNGAETTNLLNKTRPLTNGESRCFIDNGEMVGFMGQGGSEMRAVGEASKFERPVTGWRETVFFIGMSKAGMEHLTLTKRMSKNST